MKQLLLITFIALHISAFANFPLVRNFTRENYKSGTQNWAIAQDKSNTMYFANNNGLLAFDGENWTTYPIKNETNVRSIFHTKDGRFYASSFNEFGYFYELKNGKFEYHSLVDKLDKNKISSNELFNIFQGDNKIYFQSNKAIYQYDGKVIRNFPFKSTIDASAYIHNVLIIASEQKGVYMLNGNLYVQLPGSELLRNKKVCTILPFQGNKIMFVTSFYGAYIFDGSTIVPYNTGFDDFLKSNQVFCAATNGKQLVFGTVQRGIVVKNLFDNNNIYVNTFSGLQNNTVLSVAFDHQQNLWLGLDKGIDYVLLKSPVMNVLGENNLYGAGYTSFLKNNTMYFGTNQGLYTAYYPSPNSQMPLPLKLMKGMEGQVWSLTEIDNTLFCGSDKGAFKISDNSIVQIAGLQGTWAFKPLLHHPNLILGCSYLGLFILKKTGEDWKFSHYIKGKFNESSPMFEEDTNGKIWFSHWQKGMYRLTLNGNLDSITKIEVFDVRKGFPSNKNNTLFRIGNEIVFSSERGFYLYNNKTDKMEPYAKWNKLFAGVPSYMRLHENKTGDVWCVSGKFVGLAKKGYDQKYSMDSLTYRILQHKILAGFEHFNFIDSNNVILNTEDGFSSINTNIKFEQKNTFKVFLRNVIVNNEKKMSLRQFQEKTTEKASLILSHNDNSLRFEFVAPEYRNEGLVQYSYILENYDKSWSTYNNVNIKEYTQLPKGNYVFKIRARNILEPKEAIFTYSFTILPAWYESPLAITIYAIIILISLFKLAFWVNNRSKKGAREMEQIKEVELKEQKKQFEAVNSEKKKEIKDLKNQQLQYELRHKSQELASSTMNLIRKNEMLLEIMEHVSKATNEINNNQDPKAVLARLSKMEKNIKQNIESDNNWKKFEENFDLVYENYLKKLGETYPDLSVSDKKLCAYLKMDLTSKDIAPLLNMSIRSVEMNRYRLRKKMGLERDVNLGEFLQKY